MNNTNSTTEETFTETTVSDNLWSSVGIIIIIIGTVGHLLSITVMLTSKSMRVHSSTVYLITMSIVGIISLYTGLLRYIIFIGLSGWEVDIRDNSDVFCKLHMTVTYASLQYFAWLQATVAVDRLISVLFPHKYLISCKWKVGLITVFVELVLVCLLNIAVGVSVSKSDEGHCKPHNKPFFYGAWGYIDLLSYSLIPAFILVICNSIILRLLNQSKLKVKSNNTAVARSLTVMLMSLNVFFLITTLPVSVVFFLDWGTYGQRRYAITELCWTIFSLLQYAGSACTFFVYCITGSKFREELRKLPSRLGLRQKRPRKKLSSQNRQTSSPMLMTNGKTSGASYKSLQVSIQTDDTCVTDCGI